MDVSNPRMNRENLTRGQQLLRQGLYRRRRVEGFTICQRITGARARRGKRLLVHWYYVFTGIRFLGYGEPVKGAV